jgi:hypothetical protein
MTNKEQILKHFSDAIGNILTVLDEAEASFITKRTVKLELWNLCDKKIIGLMPKELGNEETQEDPPQPKHYC